MKLVLKKDWATWLDGMRSKVFKAGAEALSTQLTAFLGSNGVASLGVGWLKDVGLNWKQALALLAIQFTIRVLLAAAIYVEQKPDPEMITVTVDTEHVTRNPDTGQIVQTGSSQTVTTTPVAKEMAAGNPP